MSLKRKMMTPMGMSKKRRTRTRQQSGLRKRRFKRTRGIRAVIKRNPVPLRTLTRLRYVETMSLNITGGVLAVWKAIASLHDPNQTGVGHQPLWRDQYAAMYHRYRIHGIKYRMRVINFIANFVQVALLHRPSTAPNGTTSLDTEMERRNCKRTAFLTGINAPGHYTMFKGYLNCAKNEGMSRAEYTGNEQFEGNLGGVGGSTTPNRTSIIELDFLSPSTGVINVVVDLTFYADLFSPIQTTGS